MKPLTRILTALATLALVPPAAASAKASLTLAPPGNSAVTQYLEVVPGDTGASPPRPGGGAGAGLTSGQRARLGGLGADGGTLAAVVDATAPPPSLGSGATVANLGAGAQLARAAGAVRGSRPAKNIDPSAAPAPVADTARLGSGAGGRPAGSLILDAARGSGSGGLGILLPAIILASALGAVAHAVRQRRTGL